MAVKEVKPVEGKDPFEPDNVGQPPAPLRVQEQPALPNGNGGQVDRAVAVLTQTELYIEYGVTLTANYESVRYAEGARYKISEGSSLEDRSEAYKAQVKKMVNRVNSIAEGRAKALFGDGSNQ